MNKSYLFFIQFPQVDITQVMDSAGVVEVDGFVKLHCFPTENSKELIYFVLFKNKINNNIIIMWFFYICYLLQFSAVSTHK